MFQIFLISCTGSIWLYRLHEDAPLYFFAEMLILMIQENNGENKK